MASLRSQDSTSLPQCGFRDDYNFDTLVKSNRFLFRVYTPKERSPFSDDTEPYFVAPKFDEFYARSPVDLPKLKFPETLVGTYADVAKHMDWTTRAKSAYISTSFSFSWAIWEAVKRFHTGMKKDVEIAIIDANALGGRGATAVQLLMKSNEQERDDRFWKWHKFAQDAQSVLVYGMVPRPAVLASVPLLQILRRMPSYFLSSEIQAPGNPLTQVSWDYTSRKASYHHFCQEMTKAFLSLPPEFRLRDSTTGAVRLALSFLHPYFHQVEKDNFDIAISHLESLAITISQWPGQVWVQGQPHIQQIVASMVAALAEEHLCQKKREESEEISRLRIVVTGLEQALEVHNPRLSTVVPEDVESSSDTESEDDLEESDEPTLVASDLPPVDKTLTPLQMAIPVAPQAPIFQTPITPPESPRNSMFLPPAAAPVKLAALTLIPTQRMPMMTADLGDRDSISVPSTPKRSPLSSEPASPPPTPPARLKVFLPPPQYGLSPVVESDREEEDNDDQIIIVSAVEPEILPVVHDRLQSIPEEEADEETQPIIEKVKEAAEEDSDASVESDKEELEEDVDDDKTDIDVEEANYQDKSHKVIDATPSGLQSPPLVAWIPRPSSGLISPRLSISSIDTLIEPSEYPFKRGSVSYPEPFSFLRRFSSMTAVDGPTHSRTVSFSGISAITSDHASELPSEPSFELEPVDLALNIPLPPSPTLSTISSLSSRSLSPISSDSLQSEKEISSPTSPQDSPLIIIPPKVGMGLLSPIESEDDEVDYHATVVAETASYLVTGFLFGAFITLILFSTQRRTLLYIT